MIDIFDLNNPLNEDPKATPEPEKENIKLVGLDKEIYLKQREIERLANVYENVKKSERLRAKINKDIKAAAPMEEILKDCIECISLMTGDKVFYTQNIKYLKKMTS